MTKKHVQRLDVTASPLFLDDLPYGRSSFELAAGGRAWRVDVDKTAISCRVERFNVGFDQGGHSRHERAAGRCLLWMGAHGAITAANLPELDKIAAAQAVIRAHSLDCSQSLKLF